MSVGSGGTLGTVTIRRATSGDVATLLDLYRVLDDEHRRHHPELYATEHTRSAAWVERALADARTGVFVAEAVADGTDTVAGFARVLEVQTPEGGVLASRRFGLVDDLAVAPGARRAGVAGELLRATEEWARERGLPALEVTVWAFNAAARELYAKHGFSPLRHYLRKPLVSSTPV